MKKGFLILLLLVLMASCSPSAPKIELGQDVKPTETEILAETITEATSEPIIEQESVSENDGNEEFSPADFIDLTVFDVVFLPDKNQLVIDLGTCWDYDGWTYVEYFGAVLGFDDMDSKAMLIDGNENQYVLYLNLEEMQYSNRLETQCYRSILVAEDFVLNDVANPFRILIPELQIRTSFGEPVLIDLGEGLAIGETLTLNLGLESGGFETTIHSVRATDKIYSAGGGGGGGGGGSESSSSKESVGDYALIFDMDRSYNYTKYQYEFTQTLLNDLTSVNYIDGNGFPLPGTQTIFNSIIYNGMPTGKIQLQASIPSLRLFSDWEIEFNLDILK